MYIGLSRCVCGFGTGLFIDFELTSLSVNGNPAQPTLTADFGDIPPEESVVAVWFITSSLQGSFTNFEATFSFVNPLGIPEAGLYIIDSLEVWMRGHVYTHTHTQARTH